MAARAREAAKGAWQTVGLVALLILLSTVIAAFVISQVTDGTVELAFGAEGASYDNAASTEAALQRAAENPGSLVSDESGVVWSVQRADISIFSDHYLSPDGTATTVQSSDGDRVVAPGTAGSYEFATRNSADSEIDYALTAEVKVTPKTVNLPLEGRMKSPDGWLVGGDDAWVPLQEMRDLEDTVELAAGESRAYSLQWRWRFERPEGEGVAANDAHDLELEGTRDTANQDLGVEVVLNAIGSYDEVPSGTGTSSRPLGTLPATGELMRTMYFFFAAVAAAMLAVVVLALVMMRKRSRRDVGSSGVSAVGSAGNAGDGGESHG